MDGSAPLARTWSWADPEDDARPNFGELEPVDLTPPFRRADLRRLGLTGIQFAEWKSPHPGCLDTDIVGLVDDTGTSTEPGRIYRLGGDSYFVQLDGRDPLPFTDDCLDWAYAEHFIEHLTFGEGVHWLGEVRRVLRSGGLVRLTTPDLRLYVESYMRDDGGMFPRHREVMWEQGARPRMPERPAFMMNMVFSFWGHRWIYDLEELQHALERAGYSADRITRRSFLVGSDPLVASMDRPHRRHETMYLEAHTP
jgi:predicted SAM-dependent methyltransferase